MHYKREESFRYQFETPLNATFKIIRVNGKAFSSKIGQTKIIDISPNGMKLEMQLNIPVKSNDIEIEVYVKLLEEVITVTGQLVWHKEQINNNSTYGLKTNIDEETEQHLIRDLKRYRVQELSDDE